MRRAWTWAQAYLAQARSDWQVYHEVSRVNLAACHRLHYLQMTLEKLGKALLLAGGSARLQEVRSSHLAFVKYVRLAPRHPAVREIFGMNRVQFRARCRTLAELADRVERLNPKLAGEGPNVEYPWADPEGQVRTPAMVEFPVDKELRSPKGLHLLKDLGVFLGRFDELHW